MSGLVGALVGWLSDEERETCTQFGGRHTFAVTSLATYIGNIQLLESQAFFKHLQMEDRGTCERLIDDAKTGCRWWRCERETESQEKLGEEKDGCLNPSCRF